MDFDSAVSHGFVRVAACTVPVVLADPVANTEAVIAVARECHNDGVAVAAFPELVLSGYSIDDLMLQDVLLEAVEDAIGAIVDESADLNPVLVVGGPIRNGQRVYNCAVVIHAGAVLGVVPKSYLPTYREFHEARLFASGADSSGFITVAGTTAPFGPDLLFRASNLPDLTIHVEVCEDAWVPIPPSTEAALAGATVLITGAASPITVGRGARRDHLFAAHSQRCLAASVYAAAGPGESATNVTFDGQTMIHEAGELLAEAARFPLGSARCVADVDVAGLVRERTRQGTFDDNRRSHGLDDGAFRVIDFALAPPEGDVGLRRTVDRFPFVPDDADRLAADCLEAYTIQVRALMRRLRAIGTAKVIIGVSGGLDSTHALLVAARAMDELDRPRSDILAFTMPGFATTEHTRGNAEALCASLGVSFETLDITEAARTMLADIGHPFGRGEPIYDVTFENVQAGLRTDYLFRIANQRKGIVLGTGDLSELALGWCTYGVGDHMSHYGVNAGVPKTLMQHLIRWVADSGQFGDDVSGTLRSILDTAISPELVPTGEGEEPQSTEGTIGPYALHDFTLFHLLRGAPPSTIAFLARHAWSDSSRGAWPPGLPAGDHTAYDLATIRHWLEVFLTRFFRNQFKRSALPDGPKVVAGGSLSPRGDWRMPSDATAAAWLAELERNVPKG